jgi:hypothetical protein
MGSLHAFPRFRPVSGLPACDRDIRCALASHRVTHVRNFALGPEGTNIAQACSRWIRRMEIEHKADIALCDTPENSIIAARQLTKPGILAVFWTCAVYSREMEVFFGNPDTFPFFAQEIMALDEMQLATRPELAATIEGQEVPASWRIAAHPSPVALVSPHHRNVVLVNSNAAAAVECAVGRVEACITTESARQRNNLKMLHLFGSPEMVFFAGITRAGAELMRRAHAETQNAVLIDAGLTDQRVEIRLP